MSYHTELRDEFGSCRVSIEGGALIFKYVAAHHRYSEPQRPLEPHQAREIAAMLIAGAQRLEALRAAETVAPPDDEGGG